MLTRPDPLPGYQAADQSSRAEVLVVLDQYYSLRAHAVASDDTRGLYARFPKLALGEDRQAGVNVERLFLDRMRNINVRTVRVAIEDGDPVGVFVKENIAVAYVHGREDWIESGTASAFYTRIDLERSGGTWSIVRTDEVTQPEWPPPPTPGR